MDKSHTFLSVRQRVITGLADVKVKGQEINVLFSVVGSLDHQCINQFHIIFQNHLKDKKLLFVNNILSEIAFVCSSDGPPRIMYAALLLHDNPFTATSLFLCNLGLRFNASYSELEITNLLIRRFD